MKYRRYAAYKESGVEWLGEVPAHWEVTQFSRVLVRIETGWTPDSHQRLAEENEWAVLKVGCVRNGQFYEEEHKALGPGISAPPELEIRPGDLIMSRANTLDLVGSVGLVRETRPYLTLCDKTFRLVLCRELLPEYANYLLQGRIVRNQIELGANGASASMKNIGQDVVRRLVFPIPPEPDQLALIAFLDRETAQIDVLIARQERLLAVLQEKRQALISHAVTKGLNPQAAMKESGVEWLGDVPAHWDVPTLGYVAKITTGSTPDRNNPEYWGGTIPWLKTGEIDYELITEAEEYITQKGLDNSSAKLAPKGTLLMAMYGQGVTRGKVAILGIEAAFNQACAAISPNEKLVGEFARYYFIFAYPFIRDNGNETSQMNLGSGIIAKMRISVPPLKEQESIVTYLDIHVTKIDCMVDKVRQAITLLAERRAALISAAVTGKIDVRGMAGRALPEGLDTAIGAT